MVTSVAGVRPGETVLVPSASGGVASAIVQAVRTAMQHGYTTRRRPREAAKGYGVGAPFGATETRIGSLA